MKVVQINSCNNGSTGNIIININKTALYNDIESYMYCVKSRTSIKRNIPDMKYISSIFEHNIHIQLSKYSGYECCFSYYGTKKLIKELESINPDILHLHNLHNNFLNLKLLFTYIKRRNIKVVWTLHDCWGFTGGCPYFDILNCSQWKLECNKCDYKGYPKGKVDRTKKMYNLKKEWFSGINHMMIVTPSKWLESLVKESFLKEYPTTVINNGINLEKFHPRKSNFRSKYNIEDKFIILGVSFSWGFRKGLDVFERISRQLDDRYQIVLVGVTQSIAENLNKNIICIERTYNEEELAEIYSEADVFLNPTREDNFPTVNIESLACGTPVLTFNTGGSPECLDEKSGQIVDEKNIIDILKRLISNNYDTDNCIERGKKFSADDKFKEYIELYKKMMEI